MRMVIALICLAGYLCMSGAALDNLLPEPQIQDNRSLGDAPGKWHRTYVNPQKVSASLTVGAKSGSLEMRREGAPGTSGWRINIKGLAAGEYTLDTAVSSSSRAVASAYAFDASKKARLIFQKFLEAGEYTPLVATFGVPDGTALIRLEFAVCDNGIASWLKPRLFAGRHDVSTLPPRELPKNDALTKARRLELLIPSTQFTEIPTSLHNEVVLDPFTGMRVELDGGVQSHETECKKNGDAAWTFRIRNRAVDTSASAWQADVPGAELAEGRLVELTYRLSGLAYTRVAYPAILLGEVPLLYSSELYSDGAVHKVLCLVPKDVLIGTFTVSLRTDADALSFELLSARAYADISDVPAESGWGRGSVPSNAEAIRFDGRVRRTQRALLREILELRGKVYDYALLPEGTVESSGASFRLDSAWNVLEGMQAKPSTDFSKKEPESGLPWTGVGRAFDETIDIPLTGCAKELWLLLGARMTAFSRNGATPVMPPQFAAHEVFSIEIHYTDGTVDRVFPYSLADRGYSVQRFTGAYAVPLNPAKMLSRAILHSYFRPNQGAFFLMAATLNREGASLIPDAVLNPVKRVVRQLAGPKPLALKITADDNGFSLENGWYCLRGETRRGFAIVGLTQKLASDEPLTLEESGIGLDVNGKALTGRDFQVAERRVLKNGVEFRLTSRKGAPATLELMLRITGDESGEIRFNASVCNRGASRIAPRIRFPLLKGVRLGNSYADNWIYFPKYYSIHTNETGTFAHSPGNERAYFVQFMDAYNPAAGYGLELMTHNLEGAMMDYGLHKSASGITYYIQYPAPWQMMAPGESRTLAETSLLLHTGDWHQAFALYKRWCATWRRPVKSGNLDWWLRSWILRCEFFNKPYDWVFPIYLKDKDKYRFDAIRRLAERRWGEAPDIFHVWGWNTPPLYPGEKPRRGTPGANYADGEYNPKNYLTGAKRLADVVRCQQELGTRMSFYTIPSYLPKASPIGRTRGAELAMVLGNGQPLEDAQCYFPCPWAWADTFIPACLRAQKELGFKALYIDISPFPRDYTCYSTKHGHSVPLNVNHASRNVLKRLREGLPEGVALWHEDPAGDVETQWSSGSITYYHVSGSENRAPNYAANTKAPLLMPPRQSIIRYAFPHYKQFVIPVGLTSGSMIMRFYHAPFFNGEGIYDATIGLYNERTIKVMRKSIALQRAHDAFISDSVEPLVETEAAGIYANRFGASDDEETVWTLYNGRYETYRGAVLAVDYTDGDQFRDLWNDRPLQPILKNGKAILSIEIDPQMVGCIARIRKK